MNDTKELWTKCSKYLQGELPEGAWKAWIEPAHVISYEEEIVTLGVPNLLVKDRIESKFMSAIERALFGVTGSEPTINITVDDVDLDESYDPIASEDLVEKPGTKLAENNLPGHGNDVSPENSTGNGSPNGKPLEVQNSMESSSTRYTFDAFVIGSSNRFAHAAALSVAEKPAKAYNPLFIHGEAGLGKTHLLHSIGNYVKEHYPTYKVTYVSTETFMNEFVDAIRRNTTVDFKRRYRECDVLLVDDIQFLEGKESLQEEFFHTFNSLSDAQHQIVITSDRPPKAIATLENRLRSRFLSGLITDIQPPDLETRLAILHKKSYAEGITMKDEVLDFIANHVTDNIRELEGAFIRASAFSSLSGKPMDRELAEQVLSDIVTSNQGQSVTPAKIIEITAKSFGFSVDELCSASRRRPLTTARQIAMYLCRELTDYSYPAIGNEFGGRDHTTVIHGVSKVSSMMMQRKQIYDQVTGLIHQIKSSG